MIATNASKERSQNEKRCDWLLCYDAENYILEKIDAFTAGNSFARFLAERMAQETGTLLLDWVDHIMVSPVERPVLDQVGYKVENANETPVVLWHPEAMLPRVLVDPTLPAAPFP